MTEKAAAENAAPKFASSGTSASVSSDETGQRDSRPSVPDYDLLRLIGRGAYGEVWLARSTTGLYRAVKVVRRSAFDHVRPFEREFEGIQKFEPISHSECQVHILHVGRNDAGGYFYYVMELADQAEPGPNKVGQASGLPVQRASLPAVGPGESVEETKGKLAARMPPQPAGKMFRRGSYRLPDA